MSPHGNHRSALGKLLRVSGPQLGAFTRDQAMRAGFSRSTIERRLATGEWSSLHRVYALPGFSPTWEQRLMAACLALGPAAVASHRAAAALWKLDGIEPGVIEIYVPNDRTRPSHEVIIRRTRSLPRSDTTKLGRFPLTTVVRTLLDLGSVVDEDRLEAAFESAYRRGLTDPERARRRLRACGTRGSAGPAALKRILAARGKAEPAGSVLVVKFIRLARRGHLPPFERQWRVLDGDGLAGRIDFAYPEVRLGIEVGGKGAHMGPAAEERDSRRHNRLTAQGWRMLYFGWSDVVGRPEHVLRVVRSEHTRLRHADSLHEHQARDSHA